MVRFIIYNPFKDIDSGTPNLHSNMVRFIMRLFPKCLFVEFKIYIPIWLDLLFDREITIQNAPQIYIPIWLDLLCYNKKCIFASRINLHSNMVRFIIIFSITHLL